MPFVSDGSTWHNNAGEWAEATSPWSALAEGTPPDVTPNANAGSGASVSFSGGRFVSTIVVTTGVGPVSGGVLVDLVLHGYLYAPAIIPLGQDEKSIATYPIGKATSATAGQVAVAGQLQPNTAYTFKLVVMGE